MTHRHRRISGLILLLFIVTSPAAEAAYSPGTDLMEEVNRIQHQLYNEHFHHADSLCIALIERRRDEPLGYLLRAATLMAEMTDREQELYTSLYDELLDTAEAAARPLTANENAEIAAWGYLMLGHARAYRALKAGRFGSGIAAYRHGSRAANAYELGLERDSTLYDLYAGLGTFHYWKSVKSGLLGWIGILRDEKDQGIAELRLAADSSTFSAESARQGLLWIWLNDGQYDSVLAVGAEMATRYPDADSYIWALARAHMRRGDDREALPYLADLRARTAKTPGNYFNLIECDLLITGCWERLQEWDRACAAASRLIEYERRVPSGTRRRQQTAMAHLRRLARR